MNELYELEAEYGAAARQKLWALLGRQAQDYTLWDSSSLPEEVAEELLRSVLYTLKLYFDASGLTPRVLVLQDENQVYGQAVHYLEERIEGCKALYGALLERTPAIPHRALTDTLRSIGIGLKRYDYRHLAHQAPAEIDYQLCLPLGEEWQGISYVEEYLRRLMAESLFLGRFDPRACIRLLGGRFPEYTELLINVYEPVFARALGWMLAEGEVAAPELPVAAPEHLRGRLAEGPLLAAADALCTGLGLPPECRDYGRRTALELLPRLRVAAENGTLENLL